MSGLPWGVPRPTNRPGKPGTAGSNWLRIKRALMRLGGIDVGLLTGVVATGLQWVKVTKTYADFSTAGTISTITAYSVPAKVIPLVCTLKHSASFTGGAIATYTIDASWKTVSVLTGFDVFAAPSPSTPGFVSTSSSTPLGEPGDFASATAFKLIAASTGANLDQATQGSVDLWILLTTLP